MKEWFLSLADGFSQTFIESDRWVLFAKGFGVTIRVAVLALLMGIAIGILVAIVRTKHDTKKKNAHGFGNVILNILNAIVCADDLIVPIKIDKNSLDGMQDLVEITMDMRSFNPQLSSPKCLVTMYRKDMVAGDTVLRRSKYDVFDTKIRSSKMVDRWTFEKRAGLITVSPRSAAAIDYKIFIKEYLNTLPKAVREEVFAHAKN